jgi:predicted DNA-binding transcriptional regulator YafY
MFDGAVVDNIRKAAEQKVTLNIQYMDAKNIVSYRETEPYEIKDGAYFGYDVEKGGIRKFLLQRISSAEPTKNPFVPRWSIKI